MCGGDDCIFFDLQVILEFSDFLSNVLRIKLMNFDAFFVEEASISCGIIGEIFPRFIQT